MEYPREETETGIASKLARGTFSAIWRRWRRFREGDEVRWRPLTSSFRTLARDTLSGPRPARWFTRLSALSLDSRAVWTASSIGSRPPVSPPRLLPGQVEPRLCPFREKR